MQSFEILTIIEKIHRTKKSYGEFLRIPNISMGVYFLPAEAKDPQKPHTEDEVYYVLSGKGEFWCEGESQSVQIGTVLFVPAKAEHRFLNIAEDLTLLVFFTPAERV